MLSFKLISFFSIFSLLFLSASPIFAQTTPRDVNLQRPQFPTRPNLPTNRLLVKFSSNVNSEEVARRLNLRITNRIEKLDVTVLEGQDNITDLMAKIRTEKIEYVEIDGVAEKSDTNDTLYSSQWALPKISWNKLDASSSAYNLASPSAKIAIIDTGVDYNHPDLVGKVDTGNDYDFVNNDNDAMDDQSHGTHVAGISAANTNNSSGMAGVSINTNNILPMKVLDSQGYGYYSWVSSGIIRAADSGAKVINLSLGGNSNSKTLENAVNYAWNKGAVVIAAAGNSGSPLKLYPAAYNNAIAVWASTQNDTKASFSNYGNWVDIGAPGVSILSTVPLNLDSDGNKDGYSSWGGTSMATPHVSGVAGLLVNKNPTWTATQIRSKLESSADKLTSLRDYNRGNLGKGRLNAQKALQ